MEQLTKQQIVLLCLLVCFVSSIATGTVIISLVDQAQPAVSQTVNRVIERVVEKTAPSSSTKETVIVTDDQAAIDAIAKASKAIVRISAADGFYGLGVLVSSTGRIVTGAPVPSDKSLSVALDGGNVVNASFVSKDGATGLSLLQADQSNDPSNARVYAAAKLADSDSLKLGQSVIAIGGASTPIVGTGIISSLVKSPAEAPENAGISKIV
ncbi:MAG TPA: serine protease, partial [Nitrososphaera sp.]|nr:serine protease [Nitrososphaera sp.]